MIKTDKRCSLTGKQFVVVTSSMPRAYFTISFHVSDDMSSVMTCFGSKHSSYLLSNMTSQYVNHGSDLTSSLFGRFQISEVMYEGNSQVFNLFLTL